MAKPPKILLMCVLLASCGFIGRAMQRNFSAPTERRIAHKLTHPERSDARLAVLWIGHATVLVQLDDIFVLTDPVFTDRVGQVSPRLVEPGLDPQAVPPLAAVLISHMHFDHLSFGSLDEIEQRTPLVVVPPGVRANMPRYAFEIRELERWQSVQQHELRITAVPVSHVGGRYGIDQAFEPRAFTGYVIEYHGLSVYFGGDTAYAPQAFRATAERFPNLTLAILPICPDAPRHFMRKTHVDPREALDAFGLLGARFMLPIHFDTFLNSDDMPGACGRELRSQLQQRGSDQAGVALLQIGEQRVLVDR